MKTSVLSLLATTALAISGAHCQDPAPPAPPAPAAPAPPAKSGRATITLDIDGRHEVRTIDLDEAHRFMTHGGKQEAGPKERSLWLGVMAEDAPPELRAQLTLPEGSGLVVQEVIPDSPAAKAGLQKHDLLTKLDDQLLFNASQLRSLVQSKKDGDSAQITYLRAGQSKTVDVKLAMHEVSKEHGDFDDSHFGFNDGPDGRPGFAAPLDGNGPFGMRRDFLKDANGRLQALRKAIVVDRRGKRVIDEDGPDAEETAAIVEKELRKHGIDEKTVNDVTKQVTDALKDEEKKDADKPKGDD